MVNRIASLLAGSCLVGTLLGLAPGGAWGQGQGQVQLSCSGTLLVAEGSAELKRRTELLRFSLALEAEGVGSDAALAALQRRLATVRNTLQSLAVRELQVSSPSTWQRPAHGSTPAAVQASLQVTGQLAPARLQALVRQVGALPGVRLAPVSAEAGAAGDLAARRQLLRGAYQDARRQAQDIADAIGLHQLLPLEVSVSGGMRPMPMRAAVMADAAVPPFDPNELPAPLDRLSLRVQFCAR